MPSNGVLVQKRVCIVGAGPSGLTSIRQCLDQGLEVVCFERDTALGGLWYYKEEVKDGIASVARSTIINTSKEFSGFSDFPPPEHFPNYMHNSYMLRYFQMYAEKNGLERYVRFHTKVEEITFADDYDLTGRWKVRVQDTESGAEETTVFDGVLICTGHHVVPLMPQFKGQDKFKGKISHTHTYKHTEGYEGKRVVVVGLGNSGADASAELSYVSKVVYLSTRRGSWIRGRVSIMGYPIDSYLSTRAFGVISSLVPRSFLNSTFEMISNWNVDHTLYGIKPKHRVFDQHPTTNDALPNAILAGRIAVRPDIKEFTEDGVIFEGEDKVTAVDSVIFATGYKMTLPFIDSSIIAPSNNDVFLFKNMFQPDLRHPHTLALIGLLQPLGPIHTAAEMQSRWFAALLTGKKRLPNKEMMRQVIARDKQTVKDLFYESPRHSLETLYMPYCDELASFIGCRPSLTKIALTDPKMWYHLMFGIFNVYQYRLVGPNSWPGARDAIVDSTERVRAGLRLRYPELPFDSKKAVNGHSY